MLAIIWTWIVAHPLISALVALSAITSLGNGLARVAPRASAWLLLVGAFLAGFLRWVAQTSAFVAHPDDKGLLGPFTLPGVPPRPADAPPVRLVGRVPISTLRALATTMALAAVVAAIAMLLSMAGCGLISPAKRAEMASDAKMCAAKLAADEGRIVAERATAVLADGSLGEASAQDALAQLEAQAGKDLLACALVEIVDLFSRVRPEFAAPEAPPVACSPMIAGKGVVVVTAPEAPGQRAARRAKSWLAR